MSRSAVSCRCRSTATSRPQRRAGQPRRRRFHAAARVVRIRRAEPGPEVHLTRRRCGRSLPRRGPCDGRGARRPAHRRAGRPLGRRPSRWRPDLRSSHRPPGPSVANYPLVTYVQDGIASAMAQAKAAAGDRDVLVHGAYTAQRALRGGCARRAADPSDPGAVRRRAAPVRRVAAAHRARDRARDRHARGDAYPLPRGFA